MLGRLTSVDARTVWTNEARDFTPWLLANADYLADALGIELELATAEHPVGGFSLDLVGRDLTHDAVLIVENQLAGSDHGHLGQLLTYAAGTAASTIVWIAPAFREEHRQALDWLNEHTDEGVRFFGIQVEVVRIAESIPAALFNVVSQPNDWQKQVRAATANASSGGKSAFYVEFWTRFLDRIQAEHSGWTRARRPQSVNWMRLKSWGSIGLEVSFAAGGRLRSELYLDNGDADQNLELFTRLSDRREELEKFYGRDLQWEELSGRRACRIADYGVGDVWQTASYDQYVDWFFDSIPRLLRVMEVIRTDSSDQLGDGVLPVSALPGPDVLG